MGKKLIIKGADFSANCIDGTQPTPSELFEEQFAESLVIYKAIWSNGVSISTFNTNDTRCVVAIPKEAAISTPFIMTGSAVTADTYSLIEVPANGRTVKYSFTNSTYKIGMAYIHGTTGVAGAFWAEANQSYTLDLTDYSNEDVWLVVTIKNANDANFTTQPTIQGIGLNISVE